MRTPQLEEEAYRAEFDSGLLEVFIGASLIMLGVGWLFDFVALSSIGPALAVVFWSAAKTRLIDPRAGRVRFRPERRERIRRSMVGLVAVGTATLVLGVGAFIFQRDGGQPVVSGDLVRGLPAALLAGGALLAGMAFGLRRLYGSAAALAIAAVVVVVFTLDPGWAMLGPGAVILAAGLIVLAAFMRSTPVVEVTE